jgi:hypothetical protein
MAEANHQPILDQKPKRPVGVAAIAILWLIAGLMNCFNAPQAIGHYFGCRTTISQLPNRFMVWFWSINRNSAIFSNANFWYNRINCSYWAMDWQKVFLLSIFGGSDRCNLV